LLVAIVSAVLVRLGLRLVAEFLRGLTEEDGRGLSKETSPATEFA
jgi:hypothetical protein